MSEHYRPSLDELADYVEGLLPEAQRLAVERAVAEDASTAALLAEIEALPDVLAADPVESMPADVVARIDGALAEERARAVSSPGSLGAGARVRSLPQRWRRWPAQVLVAAAVVGAIALGSQVVDTGGDPDSAGAGSAGEAADAGTGRRAGTTREQEEISPARAKAVKLSTTTFAQDVARLGGEDYLQRPVGDSLQGEPTASGAPWRNSILADECAVTLTADRVLAVRLDGRPAVLVLRRVAGRPDIRRALAYPAQCPPPTSPDAPGRLGQPLARTTIELR